MKLLILLLSFTSSIVYSQESIQNYIADFPHYEEVLSYLDETVPSTSSDYIFKLAKKPDGYFLRISEINDEELIELENIVIWDREIGHFLPVHIPKYQSNEDEFAASVFESLMYNASRFDFMPFYGYPGWTNDTKRFLLKKKEHTPYELEVLARVYGDEASAYIHPLQLRNEFPFAKDFKDPSYERISKERVDGFIKSADSSILCWEKLNRTTPDYKPFIIKNVEVKMAHDHMHFYSYLMSVKEEELAQHYLEKAEYSEGMKQYARSILDVCAENSILITHGDTDTYPIWFLQAKEGYRTDVSVMNSSLMQTEWYLMMNKASKKYNQVLSSEDLSLIKSEYFVPVEREETPNFDALLSEIKTSIRKEKAEDALPYYELPASFELNLFGTLSTIDIKASYLTMQGVVFYDLIHNNPNKKLYTTSAGFFIDLGILLYMKTRTPQLYELSDNKNNSLADDKTLDKVTASIKGLKQINIKDAGYFGILDLSRSYYTVRQLNDETVKQQLSEELHKKFPFEFLLKQNSVDLLTSAAHLYHDTDTDRYNDFIKYIKKYIKSEIEGITADDIYNRETVQMMRDIFTIYGNKNQYKLNDDELTPTEIEMLELFQSKINELQQELEFEYINWSFENITDINLHISRYLSH